MDNDLELQMSVQDELAWEPSVTAGHIGVAAKNGIVTLTGHVATYVEKSAAERAVGRVKGVKAVAEELEVRLPDETTRTDEDIAAAAIARLAWSASIPRDSIKIRVEKGWLTVTGQLDWDYLRDDVARDLRSLSGVVGFSNKITLKPHADVSSITKDIERALHRTWTFAQDKVSVSAVGGTVRLTGTVASFHEKQLAARTAWCAPGVTVIENNIAIV